ncbi:MAG: ABC transporter permease [Actinomycetota bacterium]|nr:ABC transporter permease [Actinomycetota bacterium]
MTGRPIVVSNLLRVTQRNAKVYSKIWRSSLFFSFLNPMLFLTAMGVGLGTLINRNNPRGVGGVTYIAFIAPGLLAAACMQTATFESSWPVMSKITWQHTYEAILSTPLNVYEIFLGELTWMAVRVASVAGTFFVAMALFGIASFPVSILAIPIAVLTGLGFSAAVMAYTATLEAPDGFNALFRFVITPLFLFSGTFFPIDRLPTFLRPVAYATPLYHGVAAVRSLTLGQMHAAHLAEHVGYLLVFFSLSVALALRSFSKKLIT